MATPEQIAAGVPASANIVAQVAAPGGGMYYLGSDGGVFATGGAQYAGGVNNLTGDTLAGQHQFGANAITDQPGANGYRITDTAGHQYNFGGSPYQPTPAPLAPQPKPLAQDQAFLAFLRTSGLGVDQAVQDYTRSVNLAQQTRDAALRELDLNNPLSTAATDRQKLAQSYIDRGFSGNGQQAQAITQFGADNANKQAQDQTDYTNAVNTAGQNEGAAIGKIATTGIEQGLATGNNQGWNTFWQNEAQKYPGQSDTILKNVGSSSNNTSGSNGS